MYLISSRKGFTDNRTFGQTDSLRYIGGIRQKVLTTRETFIAEVSNKTILLLVHGFNNPFSYVLPEYLYIQSIFTGYMKEEYDYIMGYTWPSGSSQIDYFLAKKNTDLAGDRLHSWLHKLANVNCTIDIAGHSMAAMVGHKSLSKGEPIQIRNIFSFGAAISKDVISQEKILDRVLDNVDRVFAFYNRNDNVLKYWFRMMEWKQALGYAGPANRKDLMRKVGKIRSIDCSDLKIGHTDYMRSKVIVKFIADILKGQDIKQSINLGEYVSNKLQDTGKVA